MSEKLRSPALPVELNGVSVSVNGAAAGLYFVGNAEKQINFVTPIACRMGSVQWPSTFWIRGQALTPYSGDSHK